jgi:hypothetical protein
MIERKSNALRCPLDGDRETAVPARLKKNPPAFPADFEKYDWTKTPRLMFPPAAGKLSGPPAPLS